MKIKVLNHGTMAFETDNGHYLIVRQVRNRGEEVTNYSNNIGWFVVTGTNLIRFYTESNDLADMLTKFEEASKLVGERAQ